MKKNTSKQEKRYTPRALLRSGRYSAYSKDFLSVILTEPAYTLEEADRAVAAFFKRKDVI